MSSHPVFSWGYQDYVRDGQLDLAGHESSVGSGVPISDVAQIQDERLSEAYAFSGGPNDFRISSMWADPMTSDPPRAIQIISLLDVRFPFDSDFVIDRIGYWDAIGSPVYVATLPVAYSYPTDDFVRHIHFLLPAPVLATGAVVDITTTAAVSIGRFWAGPLWRPAGGIQRKWGCKVHDPGEMGKSRGRQGYPRLRQRVRQLDMQLSHMTTAQAYGAEGSSEMDLQQLGFRVGTTTSTLLFPRTQVDGVLDKHLIHRLGVYGHLTEDVNIRHADGDFHTATIKFDELL